MESVMRSVSCILARSVFEQGQEVVGAAHHEHLIPDGGIKDMNAHNGSAARTVPLSTPEVAIAGATHIAHRFAVASRKHSPPTVCTTRETRTKQLVFGIPVIVGSYPDVVRN